MVKNNYLNSLTERFVYPNIRIEKQSSMEGDEWVHIISLDTYIRKKHEDKWYLIPVFYCSRSSSADHTIVFKEFTFQVYNAQMLYKLPCNAIYSEALGKTGPIVKEDICILSEEERLMQTYHRLGKINEEG